MKILVLDIETAPMEVRTWRLKVNGYIPATNIIKTSYVLSFAAGWIGSKTAEFQHTASGHRKMLTRVRDLLDQADAVVHFNGKKFDVPTLMAEFLIHGITPPKHIPHQIDLYPFVRRTFQFPSYKLDYVCGVLELGHKTKHRGYELWVEADEERKNPKAKVWKEMEKYNKQDVMLTSKLFTKLRPWFKFTYGYKRIDEWLNGNRSKP